MVKVFECPKGHRSSAVLCIIVADVPGNLDALPYQGEFCFVCYAAWVAQYVPRVKVIAESDARSV